MQAVVAMLPLLGAMVAAILGYVFGRRLEDRKQLALQKGQAYADYLRALSTAATDSRSKEAISLAADAKTRICIYGAPTVIAALSAFEQAGARITSKETRKVVTQLIVAMRRDMGLSTTTVAELDLNHVLFGPDAR